MFSNVDSELYLMFFAGITLLAVLNPFGNLTQFLAMSDGVGGKIKFPFGKIKLP